MLLSNEQVSLRALEAEDLEKLYAWENDTSMWDCGSTIAPFSRKQLWDYIETYDGDIFSARQLRFMVIDNETGERAGMIDLFDFDAVNRRAAVGILVDASFRRQGIGEQALAVLEEYCRIKIGMHQLWAITAADNQAGRSLFEVSDYKISGRLRSWLRRGESYVDAYVVQKLL